MLPDDWTTYYDGGSCFPIEFGSYKRYPFHWMYKQSFIISLIHYVVSSKGGEAKIFNECKVTLWNAVDALVLENVKLVTPDQK